MKPLLIIALLLLAVGCAPMPPDKVITATGKVSEDLTLIHTNLLDVEPSLTGEILGRIKAVVGITESAIKQIPAIEQGAANYAGLVIKYDAVVADFWSPRQHALAWWIAGGILASVIGLGFAYSIGGAAVAGGILGAVGKVFYYGFHFLTLGFVAIFSKLHADVQTAAKTTQALKTATAKANKTGETARVQVTGTAHVTADPQILPLPPLTGTAAQPISTDPIG